MGGIEVKVRKDRLVCFTLPLLVPARLAEDFSVLKLMLVSKQSGNNGRGSELIYYRSIHFRCRQVLVNTPVIKSDQVRFLLCKGQLVYSEPAQNMNPVELPVSCVYIAVFLM